MANGDKAAAAGVPIVADTSDLRMGYDEINRVLDLLIDERLRVRGITAGGTGGNTPKLARDGLSAASRALDDLVMNDDQKASLRGYLGVIARNVGSAGATGGATSNVQADLEFLNRKAQQGVNDAGNAWNRAGDAQSEAVQAKQGNLYTDSYNRSVSGQSVKVAYLGNTGQLGFSSSSETVKQDIMPFDVGDGVLAAVELVFYRYRAEVAEKGDDATAEVGVIAEQLIDAGLHWLVFHDDDGNPQGVHYERLALTMLPAVQRLMSDRDDLARRVAALEQKGAK